MTGIDITSEYIEYATEQAKKEFLKAKFLCMDIREVNMKEKFDVVINMADGAIGYLENDMENMNIFSALGMRVCKSYADCTGKPSSDNDIQLMVYSVRN